MFHLSSKKPNFWSSGGDFLLRYSAGTALCDSHHALEHKPAVTRPLHHRAENISTKRETKSKTNTWRQHFNSTCWYPNYVVISVKQRGKEEQVQKMFILEVESMYEKLKIFSAHIPVHFKPSNTLKQNLVHPKDKTSNSSWAALWTRLTAGLRRPLS